MGAPWSAARLRGMRGFGDGINRGLCELCEFFVCGGCFFVGVGEFGMGDEGRIVGWRGRMGETAGIRVTPTLLLNIGTRDWGGMGMKWCVVKGSEEYCGVLILVL